MWVKAAVNECHLVDCSRKGCKETFSLSDHENTERRKENEARGARQKHVP